MFTLSMMSAPPSDARNFSTAAIDETKIAGCEMTVESSSVLSPEHLASKSFETQSLSASQHAPTTHHRLRTPVRIDALVGGVVTSLLGSLAPKFAVLWNDIPPAGTVSSS